MYHRYVRRQNLFLCNATGGLCELPENLLGSLRSTGVDWGIFLETKLEKEKEYLGVSEKEEDVTGLRRSV